MIKKGAKVLWNQGDVTLSGIVEEIYKYKIMGNRKGKSMMLPNNASMALYIRIADGSHILKNDSDVYFPGT